MPEPQAENIFTMIEEDGSTYLMRGAICFGEIKLCGEKYAAWGYGIDNYLGEFAEGNEAARAVVKAAWATLDAAGLKLAEASTR